MNKIERFKIFVKNHPELLKHIKDRSMTWQNFYEIYDMYGEEEDAWKDYLESSVTTTSLGLMDIIKNLDLDSIQNGVNSLERVLGLLQDMGSDKKENTTNEYQPRPIYKHFED